MSRRDVLILILGASVTLNIMLLLFVVLWSGRPDGRPGALSQEVVQVVEPTLTVQEGSVVEPSPTMTPSPQPSSTSTPTAVPSPTPQPTALPSPTTEPTETPMPTLTFTPTAEPPTPTATVVAGPPWLQYINIFRSQANLPPLLENPQWSEGSLLHSQYMVYTGQLWHDEDINSRYYTRAGQIAAKNGNIAVNFITIPSFEWAFNFWISAPFHALPILDPMLQAVGFGIHRDAAGVEQVAATLDVKSGLGELPASVVYPVMFPKDGGQTWVLRYSLPEFPLAVTSCSGYQQTSGAPIILQIGPGDQVPQVTYTSLTRGEEVIPHCVFDETTYFNSDNRMQEIGRNILNERDAIVIMPRNPLEANGTYAVRVDVNGETYIWSFDTIKPPQN